MKLWLSLHLIYEGRQKEREKRGEVKLMEGGECAYLEDEVKFGVQS